jgi:ubiquitin-activating enzyme E1
MVFEKDDDANFHIDFVAATANLRATNYGIDNVSRFEVKAKFNKFIPALSTAKSMIVGAVGFEIFKFVLVITFYLIIMMKGKTCFKNLFCNLAIPMWVFSEPLPPTKNIDSFDIVLGGPVKAIPNGKWD